MDTTCRVTFDIGSFSISFGHLEIDSWLPKSLYRETDDYLGVGVSALNLHFHVSKCDINI